MQSYVVLSMSGLSQWEDSLSGHMPLLQAFKMLNLGYTENKVIVERERGKTGETRGGMQQRAWADSNPGCCGNFDARSTRWATWVSPNGIIFIQKHILYFTGDFKTDTWWMGLSKLWQLLPFSCLMCPYDTVHLQTASIPLIRASLKPGHLPITSADEKSWLI